MDLLGNIPEIERLWVNFKTTIPDGSSTQEVLQPTLQQEAAPLQEVNDGSLFRRKGLEDFCEKGRGRKKGGKGPTQIMDDAEHSHIGGAEMATR